LQIDILHFNQLWLFFPADKDTSLVITATGVMV